MNVFGIVFQNDVDDYEFYAPELSVEDNNKIIAILNKYENEGWSVRGSAKEIAEEIEDMEV